MIRVTIKPARRLFGGRNQWKFEITADNGERIDPRDTYANRGDIVDIVNRLVDEEDVELVVMGRDGKVESSVRLR